MSNEQPELSHGEKVTRPTRRANQHRNPNPSHTRKYYEDAALRILEHPATQEIIAGIKSGEIR